MRNRSSGFPPRSHTTRAVQSRNMARGLKFRIQEVEGLYYPCSENEGADQLRGYHEADLRLCFRVCKKTVFSHDAAYIAWRFMNHVLRKSISNISEEVELEPVCLSTQTRKSPESLRRHILVF